MGLELARIPAGAELELDVQFEGVTEGVLVTVTVAGPLTGECARCLEPFTSSTKVRFQELFELAEDAELAACDDGADNYQLDATRLLDLEPALRDAMVLELPLAPLCQDGCQGLCVDCGVRLADAEPGHRHEQRGAIWAALQDFRANQPDDAESNGGPLEDGIPDGTAGPAKTGDRTDAAPGQAKEH
jgi:uncharacterized protein